MGYGRSTSISIVVIFVGALLLMACAPGATRTGDRNAETSKPEPLTSIPTANHYLAIWVKDTPKHGGVLQRSEGNVAPSLDLIAEGTSGSHTPVMLVYNSLLEYHYKPDDKMGFPTDIRPGLAERWEVSKDGLTYTFHLRKGVKFHDGKEFTSADAKYSIERIMKPPPRTPSLRSGWYTEVVDRMETPDPYSFEIRLKDIDAAFISKIAAGYTPMVPKHILEPFNARITDEHVDKVVGTGPFRMVKGKREVSWHHEKFKDYWKKDSQGKQLPYLDGVDTYVIIEEASRAAAFEAGQLDTLTTGGVADEKEREMLDRMGNKIFEYKQAEVGGLGNALFFNSSRKPYNDVRVRKAIIMGINWRAVEEVALRNNSCIGGYMPPQGQWGISCAEVAKIKGYGSATAEESAEAKRLLAEAGYANGFEANMLMGYSADTDAKHQMFQPMLAEIGIKVNLRPLERTAYYNAMTTGDFELNGMGALASLDDPNDHIGTWVICEGGRNYGKYCDPKVEDLFKQQSRELDLEKRKKIYRELELHLLDQAPLVNQWSTGAAVGSLSRTYVKGWLPMAGRHTQQLWDTAWLDK